MCSVTRCVLATCFFFSDIELACGISHFYSCLNFQQLQTVPFICFLVLSFFNNVLTSVLDSFIWKYPRALSPISLSIYLWSKIFLSIPPEIIKHLWVKQEWVFSVYDRSAWYAGSYLSQTSFLSWLSLHHLVPYWWQKQTPICSCVLRMGAHGKEIPVDKKPHRIREQKEWKTSLRSALCLLQIKSS